MSVNRFALGSGQKIDRGSRQTGIEPASRDLVALAPRIGGQRSAARDSPARDQKHIQEKFDAVLGDERARQIPDQRGFAVLKKSSGGSLGTAKLNLRAYGSRGAKGETAKLKLGRGLAGTLFDQVERKGLRFFILVFLHHL